jgi:hypothetical protein
MQTQLISTNESILCTIYLISSLGMVFAPQHLPTMARGYDHGYQTGSHVFVGQRNDCARFRSRHDKNRSKVVKKCSLPLTSARPVSMVVTELAVIDFPGGKARLCETAPGVTVEQVLANTEASLVVPDDVPVMAI